MSPPFQAFRKAQSTFSLPLIANGNAFLGDLVSSDKSNPSSPVSGGLYRLEKGEPHTITYSYDEVKIILEGEFTISDATGQEVKAVPGDIFFIPKHSTITFSTSNYGLAFYGAQRPFFQKK